MSFRESGADLPSSQMLSASDRALASEGIGILEWDLRTGRIECSPRCGEMLGVGLGHHRLDDLEEHIHAEDRERFRNIAIANVNRSDGAFGTEFRVIDPRGKARWIRCCGAIECDEDNVPVRVSSIVENITERKQGEARLRESEENFRELIRASTLLTWTVEKDGISQDLLDWFSELSGQQISNLREIASIIHPDDLGPACAAVKQAQISKTPFTTVCRFLARSGEYRYLAVRGVQIFNSDGTLRQWIGTINDITVRKSAEEIVQKSEVLNKGSRLDDVNGRGS